MAQDQAQQRVTRFLTAYERWPQPVDELSAAIANACALVEEEPW
jgi:hypothetical protein